MTIGSLAVPCLLLSAGTGVAQPQVVTVTAREGDTLMDIAAAQLGNPDRWPEILRENPAIRDPRKLQIGQRVTVRTWPLAARVEKLSGAATVRRQERDEPLRAGMDLVTGDVIRTEARSQVTIVLGDGHRILVEPESDVALSALLDWPKRGEQDSVVEVLRGRATTFVRRLLGASTFKVRSATAVASVRGTAFRARAEGDTSLLEVHEGRVSQQAGPSKVEVGAGFGTRVLAGQPPMPPRALPPPPEPGVGPRDAVIARDGAALLPFTEARGAVAYHAQVSADPGFDELVWETVSGDGSIVVRELPAGRYYWRIASRDDVGLESDYAEYRNVVFPASR